MALLFNTEKFTPDTPLCNHTAVVPAFDDRAIDLPTEEVRRRWPRFEGVCPDCGQRVIAYASARHYIAGDW